MLRSLLANNISGLLYDKSLIVAIESDTMETSLVHCLEHCYLCCSLVTIHGNELVIFPGIALYGNDKYIVSKLHDVHVCSCTGIHMFMHVHVCIHVRTCMYESSCKLNEYLYLVLVIICDLL